MSSSNTPTQALEPVEVTQAEDIEALAQFLHDEGGFGDSWTAHTWPEHPDDTGQRDGGWVKIVPSDVQAQFRDTATRLYHGFFAPRLRQSSNAASVGVTGDYVATDPRKMGDGDPYWMVEIQASGGYHSVAEIYSDTAENASAKARLAMAAWTGGGSAPAEPMAELQRLGQEYDGDALREALDELIRKTRIQATCLEHYAELSGFPAKPIPSTFHLQAGHFRTFADEAARALSATPPAQEGEGA